MAHLLKPFQFKILNIIAGILMAMIWGFFSYRHLNAFLKTGELTYLIICASESISALFFILRSTPSTVSKDPLDWIFAVAGTTFPLLFVPTSWGVIPAGKNLIFLGTMLQIFGLLSLNRSYAIVAAKRKIKTKGMYRFIRHPLYSSYCFIFTGYVLANTTAINFFLYIATMGFLFVRMAREEKHLASDQLYRSYMTQVRYRIFPFLF
jgi:protein-S-isoprenylcysteine O-methyltransferase Ste14